MDYADGALTLKNLANKLEPVADWHTLGVKLGVEDHELKEIEEQYHGPQRRKYEMLSRWLRKGQNCTWRRVWKVLMQMDEKLVAESLETRLTTGRRCPIKIVSARMNYWVLPC